MDDRRMTDWRGRVAFSFGTGRCGTRFLARLLALEPGVASVHERDPGNEAFHRYCRFYGLPVDDEGFLAAKEREIVDDLAGHELSFEASAYLALSLRQLHDRFQCRLVAQLRRPDRVVNSFVRKGWYERPTARRDPELAPGYQPGRRFHHFLARLVPSDGEFLRWQELTRVGKVAWFWNTVNSLILSQLEALEPSAWRIVKLEDLDHEAYRDLVSFLGRKATVSRRRFDAIAAARPNALPGVATVAQWSSREAEEFEREVEPMATRLGYEFRVDRLLGLEGDRESDSSPGGGIFPRRALVRATRSIARALRTFSRRLDPGLDE